MDSGIYTVGTIVPGSERFHCVMLNMQEKNVYFYSMQLKRSRFI